MLIHDKMNGRLNMAIDESLLKGMEGENPQPVIRLYGFSPPTISIGKFQKTEGFLNLQKIENDGITLVRRPTGGQAVLHDNELTYSVIMARTHIEPFRKRIIYETMGCMFFDLGRSNGDRKWGRAGHGGHYKGAGAEERVFLSQHFFFGRSGGAGSDYRHVEASGGAGALLVGHPACQFLITVRYS